MNRLVFPSVALEAFRVLSCATSPARAEEPPPLTGTVYATSWFGGVIAVVDLAEGKVKQTIPVGIHNHNVALRPDQKQAWVTNNNAGSVSVIDTAKDEVVKTIPVSNAPDGIAIKP